MTKAEIYDQLEDMFAEYASIPALARAVAGMHDLADEPPPRDYWQLQFLLRGLTEQYENALDLLITKLAKDKWRGK